MKDRKENTKPTFKLDTLDKKEVFKVPEDYFLNLPTIIQARVIKPEKNEQSLISWSFGLKYALPVATLIIVAVYLVIGFETKKLDVQAILDEVSTEELISYLDESDLSTDELLSMIDLDDFDVDGLIDEEIELLNDEEWDEILDEYPDFENDI